MTERVSQLDGATAQLRRDAQDNRDRILDAARELFGRRGLDVPMAAIARHARVGVATLYRRFPTKESLVAAAFADQFTDCLGVLDDAIADPDPWRGFCAIVANLCAMQADDRGLCAAFLGAFPDAIDMERHRQRAAHGFLELVERAKAVGALRADFAPSDLPLLLMANNGIVADSPAVTRAASRRLVGYLLDAFRAEHADPANPLPPPAPLRLRDIP